MSGSLDLKTRWQVGRVHPTPEIEPKGWTLKKLCDVAKLESGHTPSRKRTDYWDGDIPWLSLHDSKEIEGAEIFQTQHTVSKLGLDNSSARLLPEGTVALSRTATIGKVAILGREMATSQDFACYICGPDLLNQYLAHLFRSMEAEWDRLMAGSTHNTIYMPLFQSMQVLVPPLPEQQAIAAALSDADGVVAGLERVIAKKRLIKQGAAQDLLTARRRLPGFSGAWEVKRFAQIAKIRNTKIQTLGNAVAQNCIELEQLEHETGRILFWVDATKRTTVKYQFEAGDVLFGRLRPYLRKFHRANIQGVCSTEIWPLMTQGVDSRFLYQVVQSDGFIAAACEAYGTHMPRADWGKLATQEVQVPADPNEQGAIGAVLGDMEKEIQTLEARLTKARAVKEGMMQNLLTGRVRLV